jgi:signal peptidase II
MTNTHIEPTRRQLMLPLLLIAGLVILDQVTKALIVAHVARIEFGGPIIEVFGDIVRVIHVRNLGIAFSIGRDWAPLLRRIAFVVLPLFVVAGLGYYYVASRELTGFQRWALAAIIAGGAGNLIDRILRPDGVVDWIDVKFYGILGMDRWPTFNVADASVVVGGILLVLGVMFESRSAAVGSDGA